MPIEQEPNEPPALAMSNWIIRHTQTTCEITWVIETCLCALFVVVVVPAEWDGLEEMENKENVWKATCKKCQRKGRRWIRVSHCASERHGRKTNIRRWMHARAGRSNPLRKSVRIFLHSLHDTQRWTSVGGEERVEMFGSQQSLNQVATHQQQRPEAKSRVCEFFGSCLVPHWVSSSSSSEPGESIRYIQFPHFPPRPSCRKFNLNIRLGNLDWLYVVDNQQTDAPFSFNSFPLLRRSLPKWKTGRQTDKVTRPERWRGGFTNIGMDRCSESAAKWTVGNGPELNEN